MGASIAFYLLAALTLLSAIGVVAGKNPVHSALSLVVTLVSVAGLFALLQGEFLAVIQVLTYAGAILVLFVFIIMLLNLKAEELEERSPSRVGKVVLSLAGLLIFLLLSMVVSLWPLPLPELSKDFGSVTSVGAELFLRYWVPFEVTGVLLTVALVVSVLLAKKDLGLKR